MSKYQCWYDQIIDRARERDLDCYSEWHHVLPRSLGGEDESENLVQLTYREHFLVHWLLTRIVCEGRGRRAMLSAFILMGTMGLGDRTICSWQYAMARRVAQDGFREARLVKHCLRQEELQVAKKLKKAEKNRRKTFEYVDQGRKVVELKLVEVNRAEAGGINVLRNLGTEWLKLGKLRYAKKAS